MDMYNLDDLKVAIIKNDVNLDAYSLTSFLADNIVDEHYMNIGTRLGSKKDEIVLYGKLEEPYGNQDIVSFFIGDQDYIYIDLADLTESHTSTPKQILNFLNAIDYHNGTTVYTVSPDEPTDTDEEYVEALGSILDIADNQGLSDETMGLLMATLDTYGVQATQMLLDAKDTLPDVLSKLIKELRK